MGRKKLEYARVTRYEVRCYPLLGATVFVCLHGLSAACRIQPAFGGLGRHHPQHAQWAGVTHVDQAAPARVTPAVHGVSKRSWATFNGGRGTQYRWRRASQSQQKHPLFSTRMMPFECERWRGSCRHRCSSSRQTLWLP